jgi:hypothetical protein
MRSPGIAAVLLEAAGIPPCFASSLVAARHVRDNDALAA